MPLFGYIWGGERTSSHLSSGYEFPLVSSLSGRPRKYNILLSASKDVKEFLNRVLALVRITFLSQLPILAYIVCKLAQRSHLFKLLKPPYE